MAPVAVLLVIRGLEICETYMAIFVRVHKFNHRAKVFF